MVSVARQHVDRLIRIESAVKYNDCAPPDRWPFIVVDRKSAVLMSAPHGAKSCRRRGEYGCAD